MLLTADHLAALQELGETPRGVLPRPAANEQTGAIYRALERDGLARRTRGRGYSLTAEGREAWRLVAGMLTSGCLRPREVMAPDWHVIDDDILAALEAAERDTDRVALADAPLLLTRGLATLHEEAAELRVHVALNTYGKAWLELASRVREQVDTSFASGIAIDMAAGNVGSVGTEAQPNAAPL